MSGQDLRKFMNILNESFVAPSAPIAEEGGKTYNVHFIDYNDGEDKLISFASEEDAEIYCALEAGIAEGGMYSDMGMESTSYVNDVAEKIVPVGTLAEFAEAAFSEDEFNENAFFAAMDILEPFMQDYNQDDMDESIMETGNANAQQKGIHFSGKPANKNKGDMDLSSPKSKAASSKTPLAQAKSGTNVGKIKS